jgi:Beta propeller domain
MRRLIPLLLLAPALASCTDDDSGSHAIPAARLLAMSDCDAAANYIKQVAIKRVNAQIDAQIKAYNERNYCGDGRGGEEDSTGSPGGGNGSGGGSGSSPTTGTGTNNQVSGVDEADFVKNDGQYIYLAQNGVLRIVDAWPADQAHTVSTTALDGEPKKLFVEGAKALVYTAIGQVQGGSWNRECTYGYDCDFTGDGTATRIQVFDISNRAAPHLERTIDLAGSLITARRVGTAVHTVVTKAANPFTDLNYYPDVEMCGAYGLPPTALDRDRVRNAYEALRRENIAKIEATPVEVLLPTITDSAGAADVASGPSCSDLYASSIADGTAYTSIVSVDLQHPGPVKAATIISRAGAVYASPDALYIAVPHSWQYSHGNSDDLSTVHKFRISDTAGQTRYVASGSVKGRALNQFAMDEREDVFRIATTDGHAPNPDAVSYMTSFAEQGDELVQLDQIGGIAPSEDIRSVRFDGDHAFLVTFKKTDPLFAFDLSNPVALRQLGELKIPGFSTYMHLLDSGHLLTIGYDADDHGDFAFFDGIMLQIFDVTNLNAPTLLHKHIIGTRGSSSEALTNHLAFTWYPERGLLALPMTICEGGNDGVYGQTMTFNGLMVFDASIGAGFAEHGRVPHAVGSGISCGNWWTNASSTVKRSLFLDQYVYSISDAELKVRDVGALSTELVTVPLH